MPQHNLTRLEAITRAQNVDVSSYEVTLVLTGTGDTFRSKTTVRFTAAEGASTFIDAITADVHSITLNGEELPVDLVSEARIELPNLAKDNELTIDADFFYMNTGEGLHRFVDPVDNEVYLYTQFEVPDARRVFPVFEQPDLKACFSFTVLAPEHWVVVSNSRSPIAEAPDAESLPAGIDVTGLKVWAFAPTPPISSYITAIVAGPYASVTSELTSTDGDVVPLGVFCRASLMEYLDAENIFTITRQGFAFFEELFGTPYPFEKYDQLFVPEFNAGAMENAGAVTFLENYVFRSRPTEAMVERRAVTILHELAHMWFGDLVTMKWWNDLWLNESFAEFMSTLATAEASEFTDAWTTFAALEKSWAYRQDQLPSTHPIEADITDLADVEVNFDGITYAKGASVLKQLVAYVGRENFFAGLKNYFDKHAWSNTELVDLLTELEAASGRDLQTWVKLWLQESGVNVLRPEVTRTADGTIAELSILQQPFVIPGNPEPSLRPHRLAVGLYSVGNGTLKRSDLIELDVEGERTTVPLPDGAKADMVLVNDADLTYAKVRMDPASLETAISHVRTLEDSLSQLLVLSTVWDMVRDAELPVENYISLVRTALPQVTHSTGLMVQLRQLVTSVFVYTPADKRTALKEQLAAELLEMAQQAEQGSDHQFQLFSAHLRYVSTPAQLDYLAEVLAGSAQLPAGVSLDTDLTWEIVIALAAAGRMSESQIEEYRSKDNTAAGNRHARTALAAIATAEVKTQAFLDATGDTSLPNATLAAVLRGYSLGLEQEDGSLIPALEPVGSFAEEYFDRVAGWWETRTLEMAQSLTLGLFPPASEETAKAAEAWLDSHPAAPKGLLRSMRESLADTRRALAVRALSAGQTAGEPDDPAAGV